MALVMLRSTFARGASVGTSLGKQATQLTGSKLSNAAPIQVATLRATYGEPFGYEKPFDYKNKRLNIITEFIDNTYSRINENSKVIVVEGSDAVGKNDFAKRLAKNFDLLYVPSCDLSTPYIEPANGFDIRTLNEMLPEHLGVYDVESWLKDPHPEKHHRLGNFQLKIYFERYRVYKDALLHLLSTGQGIVVTKSVFGDIAYVEALRKLGHISRNLHKHYHKVRDNTICELPPPHITIYLDAPVSTIKDRIKKRADPAQVNSPNMNDEYLQAVEWAFKERTLPKLRQTGECLEIDWTEVADDMDMDVITEELQEMHLEAQDAEDIKFQEWYRVSEDDMCQRRKNYANPRWLTRYFGIEMPMDCPEILIPSDDYQKYKNIVLNHPAVKYKPGYAPELGYTPELKLF